MGIKIFNNKVEIIDSYPAVYIPQIDSVVIADLHLGYERMAAEEGIFIPETQFKEELKILKGIIKMRRASRIIINGDIKNEFSANTYHEFKEVGDMFKFLKENFEQVTIIKGNHDNYIFYITSKFDIELYEEFLIKDYFFVHGHKKVKFPKKAKTVIIAHEHPSLILREGYDKIKIPCLLFGKTKDKKNFICLPAISSWASGTNINLVSKEELLSPILREDVDFENLSAVALDKETGALNFGKIKELSF